MKKFLILPLVLCACAKEQPASHVATDNAVQAIEAMYEALPVECKTNTTAMMKVVAQNDVRQVRTHCDNEKAKLERENLKWKGVSGLLVLVMVAYAVKRFLR